MPRRSPGRQRGSTLIELMVSMVLGLLLALAVLMVLKTLTQHDGRMMDNGLRDNESRAAMDLLAHDLSGAGFLLGASQVACDAVLTYNALNPTNYYARLPVDAIAGLAGTAMPFSGSLVLNYPASGSGISSDVLIVSSATSATQFNDTLAPMVSVAPNGAFSPMILPSLPVVSSIGLTVGDVALVHVPINGRQACLRVPISGLVPTAGSIGVSSAGSLMPAASYAGFSSPATSAGFSGALSNAGIFQGRVIDIGTPASPTQVTTAFYVDGSTNPWPTLMRASFSLLDDTPVGMAEPIAAGVVALQVLFGVDPAGTGQVSAYENGATLHANGDQWAIRSIRLALVTRSLHPDPGFTNTSSTITIPGGFASVPVGAAYVNYRFAVQQTEVAVRNCLWQGC